MPAEEIEVPTLYDRAFNLASLAHSRQRDKGGRPYIEHPMTVAQYSVEMLPDFEVWQGVVLDPMRAAVLGMLHDVFEDCEWVTMQVLSHLFPTEIVDDVLTLSFVTEADAQPKTWTQDERRRQRDRYLKAILNATSPYPLLVKAADMRHNTQRDRVQEYARVDPRGVERSMRKYADDLKVIGFRDPGCPFADHFDHVPSWIPAPDHASLAR